MINILIQWNVSLNEKKRYVLLYYKSNNMPQFLLLVIVKENVTSDISFSWAVVVCLMVLLVDSTLQTDLWVTLVTMALYLGWGMRMWVLRINIIPCCFSFTCVYISATNKCFKAHLLSAFVSGVVKRMACLFFVWVGCSVVQGAVWSSWLSSSSSSWWGNSSLTTFKNSSFRTFLTTWLWILHLS